MHIPDGFLSPAVALVADAAAVGALGAAALAVRREARTSGGHGALSLRRPPLGATAAPAVGALVLAAQMLNMHVAGGTSGHLVGAVLACVLLGAPLGFLTISAVLAVQALAFADGGVLALGANVLVMGGIGALAAICGDLSRHARLQSPRMRLVAGGTAGALAVLVGAVAVGGLVAVSGTADGAVGAMARAHLPIAALEGALTVGALLALGVATAWRPRVRALAAGAAIVALLALAPLASSQPDGLERVALDLGFAHQAEARTALVAYP